MGEPPTTQQQPRSLLDRSGVKGVRSDMESSAAAETTIPPASSTPVVSTAAGDNLASYKDKLMKDTTTSVEDVFM